MAAEPQPRLALTFGAVTEKNVEQLKVLNRAIFPINYPERMYKDVLAFPDVTQVGWYGGRSGVVWCCCWLLLPLRLPAACCPLRVPTPTPTPHSSPQLAYHNDVLVGAIACRMEKTPQVRADRLRASPPLQLEPAVQPSQLVHSLTRANHVP